jgi:His-Xaa-Ser system protein HxsD
MKRKSISLVSLASALAAISPSIANATPTKASGSSSDAKSTEKAVGEANAFFSLGEDLMGLRTSVQPDGTILAQHVSHSSHSSHSSHYSSRWMASPALVLTFARQGQAEIPLRAAAYRMAGSASCAVDLVDDRWVCSLSTTETAVNEEVLRQRFLAVLNDENLRELIEQRTAPMRDVIVALAFGSLVRDEIPAA